MSLNYNDYAVATSPSSSIATGDTSIDVSDNTAYPNPPFLIDVFEGGNSPNDAVKQGGTVERMRVTATSGTGPYTWTVDRDYNGHNGSAQSFSTSATVWHVQPAKAMGPDRAVVQSQISNPSKTRVYDDFDRSSLGNLVTGETWSDPSGNFSVSDGILVHNNYDSNLLYHTGFYSAGFAKIINPIAEVCMFAIAIQDTSNYLYAGRSKGHLEINKIVSGSKTNLIRVPDLFAGGEAKNYPGSVEVGWNFVTGSPNSWEVNAIVGGNSAKYTDNGNNDADVDAIFSNASSMGIHAQTMNCEGYYVRQA